MKWGLIPNWAKDASVGPKMINAMSETAAEKPAFREAMQKRRCLIPADGFYEWKQAGRQDKSSHTKLNLLESGVFAFAGSMGYMVHTIQAGGEIATFRTILTTESESTC